MKIAFRTEEVKTEQLDLTGSIFGAALISGTILNVSAVSGTFTRLNNPNGQLLSTIVGMSPAGSPGTYGALVQAGVTGELLAATGSIKFPISFTSLPTVTVTCQRSGTLFPYIVSGTGTWTTSGVTIGGQSGLAYNWIAVGL